MIRSASTSLLCALLCTVAASAPLRVQLDPAASDLKFSFDTTLHRVHGTLPLTGGEIVFDPETGQASGEIVVDARAADTGNEARDRKMHGKVLETALYPRFVFRPKRVSGSVSPDRPFTVDLIGTLEIHGERHPMTLRTEVEPTGATFVARTKFVVPYVAWGMKNPSMFVLRVAKTVDVEIEARGTLVGVDSPALAQTSESAPAAP